MSVPKETATFRAVFGVVPGYDHANDVTGEAALAAAADAWNAAMEDVRARSQIVVGATLTLGRVVYPREFGCPTGGEIVVVASGSSNPEFADPLMYRLAAEQVVLQVKDALQQSRVLLEYADGRAFYYA